MKLKVRVQTNSKKQKIETDEKGLIRISTNQKPVEGKANQKIVEILAEYLRVKPNRIFLISGEKSKDKIFEIEDYRK